MIVLNPASKWYQQEHPQGEPSTRTVWSRMDSAFADDPELERHVHSAFAPRESVKSMRLLHQEYYASVDLIRLPTSPSQRALLAERIQILYDGITTNCGRTTAMEETRGLSLPQYDLQTRLEQACRDILPDLECSSSGWTSLQQHVVQVV